MAADSSFSMQKLTEHIQATVSATVAELLKERFAKESEQRGVWIQEFVAASRRAERDEKADRGLLIARVLQALTLGRGDGERAIREAQKRWPGAIGEGVAKALSAGDTTAGGFLVPPDYQAEIIELLRAQAIVRRMNPVVLPMPNGTLSIPKLTGGATASYVSENTNIPSSQPTTGMLKLTARKLVALVPISNDLLRFSNPAADTVVRDDLVAAMALREDLAFIRGDGVSDTPLGLRYVAPAANVLACNATVNLANVTSDLGRLMLALLNANVRMLRPGWLIAPRTYVYLTTIRDANGNFAFRDEMLRGVLWGMPFAQTTQIPINLAVTGTNESEIYLADFADVVVGDSMRLMIDVSSEAAYYDTPTAAVQSAFSRDQTVVRVIAEHDFGMRHDESIALLKDVDWIP